MSNIEYIVKTNPYNVLYYIITTTKNSPWTRRTIFLNIYTFTFIYTHQFKIFFYGIQSNNDFRNIQQQRIRKKEREMREIEWGVFLTSEYAIFFRRKCIHMYNNIINIYILTNIYYLFIQCTYTKWIEQSEALHFSI